MHTTKTPGYTHRKYRWMFTSERIAYKSGKCSLAGNRVAKCSILHMLPYYHFEDTQVPGIWNHTDGLKNAVLSREKDHAKRSVCFCGIILLYAVYVHYSSSLIIKSIWSIARLNKARWESHTENAERKKGRERERCEPAARWTRWARGQVKSRIMWQNVD